MKLHVDPGELRVLRFVPVNDVPGSKAEIQPEVSGTENSLRNSCGIAVFLTNSMLKLSWKTFPIPERVLVNDSSDTWAHGIDRYTDSVEDTVAEVNFSGRFVREIVQHGHIGNSSPLRIFRIYADSSEIHITLRVDWHEKHKVLKLVMPLKTSFLHRTDGICGGGFLRPMDGVEHPIQGWTHIPVSRSKNFVIISPDIFALDGTPERVRLTLLRSCMLAQHDPWEKEHACVARFSDRGEYDFHFVFCYGSNSQKDSMTRLAMMQRPMPSANMTRGMEKVY